MTFGLSNFRFTRFETEAILHSKGFYSPEPLHRFYLQKSIMTATTPLALTTTFTPPPACSTDTWYIEYVKGTYYYTTSISNSLEGWYLSQGPTDWSSCFPSGYQATTDFYYSPGVCPSGYSIASSEILSIGISSETRATCCPS